MLYPQMIGRLAEFIASEKYKSHHLAVWGAKRSLHSFLTRRCSKEFLALYLQTNSDLINSVCHPSSRLNWSSEVDLAIRLHALGLLPEDYRKIFVQEVSSYAISGEDVYALDSQEIRSVFTDVEFENLVATVREELLPELGEVRKAEQHNYSRDEPADEYMSHVIEGFETLKRTFSDDAEALQIVEHEIDRANDWIVDNNRELPELAPRSLDTTEINDKPHGTRSIFDDIDI